MADADLSYTRSVQRFHGVLDTGEGVLVDVAAYSPAEVARWCDYDHDAAILVAASSRSCMSGSFSYRLTPAAARQLADHLLRLAAACAATTTEGGTGQ